MTNNFSHTCVPKHSLRRHLRIIKHMNEAKVNPDAGSQINELVEVADVVVENSAIVVFNDDFNTFDHVIATLIAICKHTRQQAEQCTWLIHHKGKCKVKEGQLPELKSMKQAICEAGIDARIY